MTPLAELDGALRSYAFDTNDAGVIVTVARHSHDYFTIASYGDTRACNSTNSLTVSVRELL